MADSDLARQAVATKGYAVLQVESTVASYLTSHGAKNASKVLDVFEQNGRLKIDVPPQVRQTASKLWKVLEDLGLTQGRPEPVLEGFVDQVNAGCSVQGYWNPQDDHVGLSQDLFDGAGFLLLQTLIEEYAHYLTKACDCTRDIQFFLTSIAAKAVEVLL